MNITVTIISATKNYHITSWDLNSSNTPCLLPWFLTIYHFDFFPGSLLAAVSINTAHVWFSSSTYDIYKNITKRTSTVKTSWLKHIGKRVPFLFLAVELLTPHKAIAIISSQGNYSINSEQDNRMTASSICHVFLLIDIYLFRFIFCVFWWDANLIRSCYVWVDSTAPSWYKTAVSGISQLNNAKMLSKSHTLFIKIVIIIIFSFQSNILRTSS